MDFRGIRIQQTNQGTGNDLAGIFSKDIVGEKITNIVSNAHEMTKTLIGFRWEGGSITFVENTLPPVELEKLGNIRNISEGFLDVSNIALEIVGCKVVLKINDYQYNQGTF